MKSTTTKLLRGSAGGDKHAVNALFEMVYEDLRRRARAFFREESPLHTLQPTALVHEAFLKMIDQRQANWHDHVHFCRVASLVMRRILVDHARRKKASKRGAGEAPVSIPTRLSPSRTDDVILIEGVLNNLEASDQRQAAIVEMRFYGGMTVEQVSQVLDMPKRTVEAEWTMIRARLRREMAVAYGSTE